MRRRKSDLTARVNGNLRLEFGDVTLTSYAGLELFGRYLRQSHFNQLIRHACADTPLGGDFGVVAMIRLLLALVVLGGRRLRHLAYLADDVAVQRFAGLRVVPTARTVSRWSQSFSMKTVTTLQVLNAAVIGRVVPRQAWRTLTVDVDGTVVSTGLQVERARRGFNPHHRKVPSYYPIVAHLAETTHVLRVQNRSGDVHDGKASLPFLRDLWTQIRPMVRQAGDLRFRFDGAFFRQDVLRWLTSRGAGYAIKVPFYQWLDLQAYIRQASAWTRVAADVWGFTIPLAVTPWATTLAVTIYRKRVHHRSPKNYQLDLFDPNDGHWEYSAVASNLDFAIRPLWHFMCGRGLQEKTLGQLKSGLAFQTVPTQAYAANSAWQQVVTLAHNLLINFQIETGAACRRPTRKRTVLPRLQSIQTLRFVLFHRAAQLLRPAGTAVLRLTDNPATRAAFTRIEQALARAA
ncbi:MAG: IS1380 family transposase [Acidobacteria bacterium]|nr:IS1380 family transposase [Acidobacteriota bacterium]